MKLTEALNITPGSVISLVGGGGKTSLMFALTGELAAGSRLVITTTTTKILEPSPDETPLLLLEKDAARLVELAAQNLEKYRHITLASERINEGKLKGISPEAVARLARLPGAPYVIVEADGARHLSLKAPGPDEPVIPASTTLVVPVAGIDALDKPLTEEHCFRAETAAGILGLPPGVTVTAGAIARLITHPQGIAKGSPAGAAIVPFINKIDMDELLSRGREIATLILAARHPQIQRVVLGAAQAAEPVLEVISR